MLKIQVLGKGLIPRGYGIAPRKEPFSADKNLISLILRSPGLSIKYISPVDGRAYDLDKNNFKRIWDKYSGKEFTATKTGPAAENDTTAPKVPEPKFNSVPNTPPVNTSAPATNVVKPETNTNQTTPAAPLKPIVPPEEGEAKEEKRDNNNNNNKGNHHNNKK